MPLIHYDIIIILTWSAKCVLSNGANQATASGIAVTKRCVSVVTLSTQENAKMLQLLKSGFKCPINSNNYQSKRTQVANQLLRYLVDRRFRFFVL